MARKPAAHVAFTLRIRETLRARIEASARKRDVSMNAEIAERVERSFLSDKYDEIAKRMERLETLVQRLVANSGGR